jgi:RNA polymerase sigma-70 factor (ECF subfamily)
VPHFADGGSPAGGAAFTTTHWSVVNAAADRESPAAREALALLCQAYWQPLYAYVRRRGYDTPDAQDLVQSFFERAIQKNYVAAADRERGRFRTFLLSALEHFLAKEWRKSQRLKRGGGRTMVSLDHASAETAYLEEPCDDLSAEKLYDRRWALTLLEQAISRMRAEYAEGGRARLFAELSPMLSGDKPDVSYAELAERLSMSEGAIKVAVHRLRHRYVEILRAEVAQTVQRPEQVDEELRHLIAALS